LLWALSVAGLIAASYFLNRLCFYLSPVALVVVCFYSLTKRFSDYTHVFLGIALALAPIGAWLAVKGEFGFGSLPDLMANKISAGEFLAKAVVGIQPIVLAVAVVFWLIGFDIIYALQDYEFDRAHGLHSLVVAWGPKNALRAAFLSHMITCGLLLIFGLLCRFRVAYTIGWILIVLCLALEHWIARRRNLNWVQNAFFRLNAVVSLAFLAVTAAEVVFKGGPFPLTGR
jgi:4-hydroxybenzoate polyprenyltransferase